MHLNETQMKHRSWKLTEICFIVVFKFIQTQIMSAAGKSHFHASFFSSLDKQANKQTLVERNEEQKMSNK